MLKFTDMIERIRATTHDEQETGYTDDTLVKFLNDGVRFIRRMVFDINADLLVDTVLTGDLSAGTATVELTETAASSGGEEVTAAVRLAHVTEVRVGGCLLAPCQRREIADVDETGKPSHYYLLGFSKVGVWPVPETDTTYEVVGIKDFAELTIDDASPLPTELDDFIYEYACLRASMTDEFDMTQETSVMGQIATQIERTLQMLTPPGVQAGGYWDAPKRPQRDYGNRGRLTT